MDKTFNTFLQLNKDTEVCHISNRARNLVSYPIVLGNGFPRVTCKLFDAQRKALIIFVNI